MLDVSQVGPRGDISDPVQLGAGRKSTLEHIFPESASCSLQGLIVLAWVCGIILRELPMSEVQRDSVSPVPPPSI